MKRISSLVLVFLVLFSFNVFAGEDNLVSEEVVIEETEIIEGIENIEDIEDTVDHLTYIEVIEKIVQTINKRDSYYFEISNPEDYKSYMRKLEIDIPEEDIVTRIGFISLLNDITEKMTGVKPYTTDLIEVKSIFTDLEELTEEEILDVEIAFCQGLMRGTTNSTFGPFTELSRNSLDIILKNIESGYSRKNLFEVANTGFTLEERTQALSGEEDKKLIYSDIEPLLNSCFNKSIFCSVDNLNAEVSIKEFLKYYNNLTDNTIIFRDADNFYYPAEDTFILSSEEWEYLITNLDKPILYSEAKVLCERTKIFFEDKEKLSEINSWEEVELISQKYLPFASSIVTDYKSCMSYFLDFTTTKIERSDFARAIHESQHEGSARLSNRYQTRRKNDDMWQIRWSSEPSTYYYYDYISGNWIDSKSIYTVNSSTIYRKTCPEGLLDDDFLKDYCTNSDLIANIYGVQGLLQEYVSYALEGKVELVSTSLGLNDASTSDADYDWILMFKYMTIEHLNYMKETNPENYKKFMNDTDMIRMLNNTYKDFDEYETIFKDKYLRLKFWFTSGLDEWGEKLGCPISFLPVEVEEEVEIK